MLALSPNIDPPLSIIVHWKIWRLRRGLETPQGPAGLGAPLSSTPGGKRPKLTAYFLPSSLPGSSVQRVFPLGGGVPRYARGDV